MPRNHMGMYTDAQWRWLHDRYIEGYSKQELARFAVCHKGTMLYHWERLGLSCTRDYLPNLDRAAFE